MAVPLMVPECLHQKQQQVQHVSTAEPEQRKTPAMQANCASAAEGPSLDTTVPPNLLKRQTVAAALSDCHCRLHTA
jgi:hypothetical protein